MNTETSMPQVEPISAETLTQLEDQIETRLCGRIRQFRLQVCDRGLILRGYCHTYYAKQLAQQTFMEITRLPIHANEIQVR